MNGFFIDGNVCGDPQVKPVGTEWTVLEFQIGNNDNRKKEGEEWKTIPVFIWLKYWTKNPTTWIQKIVKGAYISCAGKMTQDNWEQDGQKRSKIVYTIDGLPTIRASTGHATTAGSAAPDAPPENDKNDDPPPF